MTKGWFDFVSFIVDVDRTVISLPDYPLLIVDLYGRAEREFRSIPAQVQSVETNSSIKNMGFEEFAGTVVENRVCRGLPRS